MKTCAESLNRGAASKVRYIEDHVGFGIHELLDFPKFVYIEPINQCNARCVMCGIDFDSVKPEFMKPDLFERITQELASHADTIDRVGLFLDCEPLLDPDLGSKIKSLKEIGIRTTYLNTNGSLMTCDRARELIGAGLDLVYFSIDAVDAEKYNAIRRGLDYEEVRRNVLNFIRIRDELNANLTVRILMTLQDSNENDAEAFVRYWQSVTGPEDQAVVNRAHNWAGAKNVTDTWDREKVNSRPCIALWSTLVIRTDGEVTLCCLDTKRSAVVGNVRTQSIEQIWHSDSLTEYREAHLDARRREIAICDGCPLWAGRFERGSRG